MLKRLLSFIVSFIGAYIMVLARVFFAYLVSPMAALAWNSSIVPAFELPCVTGKEAFCVLVLFSLLFMYRKL